MIASLPAESLPRLEEVGIDKTVLVFTVLIALATGSILRPGAGAAGVPDRLTGGAEERRTRIHGRAGRSIATRALLVVSEVALALVLLVGAGLMLRTFQHLRRWIRDSIRIIFLHSKWPPVESVSYGTQPHPIL